MELNRVFIFVYNLLFASLCCSQTLNETADNNITGIGVEKKLLRALVVITKSDTSTPTLDLPQCQVLTTTASETCKGGPLDLWQGNHTSPMYAYLQTPGTLVYGHDDRMQFACQWTKEFATWSMLHWEAKYGRRYLSYLHTYYTVTFCENHALCDYSHDYVISVVMLNYFYPSFFGLSNPMFTVDGKYVEPQGAGLIPLRVQLMGNAVAYLGGAWATIVGHCFNALIMYKMLKYGGATVVYHLAEIFAHLLISMMYNMRFISYGFIYTSSCLYINKIGEGLQYCAYPLSQLFPSLLICDRFIIITFQSASLRYRTFMTKVKATIVVSTCILVIIVPYALIVKYGDYNHLVWFSVTTNALVIFMWSLQIVLCFALCIVICRQKIWNHMNDAPSITNSVAARSCVLLIGTVVINIVGYCIPAICLPLFFIYALKGDISYLFRPDLVRLFSLLALQPWLDLFNSVGFLWHLLLSNVYRTAALDVIRPLLAFVLWAAKVLKCLKRKDDKIYDIYLAPMSATAVSAINSGPRVKNSSLQAQNLPIHSNAMSTFVVTSSV